MHRFRVLSTNTSLRYSLHRDVETGQPVFAIPVSNRIADYEEYYWISEEELRQFLADVDAAKAFAVECGRLAMDERLVLAPGTDRGRY